MGILILTIKEISSKIRMNKLILLGFCVIALAAMVTAQGEVVEERFAPFRAAAAAHPGGQDCNCQCSRQIFQDKRGRTHGNCRRAGETGAKWCYVDPSYSQCPDLKRSTRFNGKDWSYQACATPSLTSPECDQGIIPKLRTSGRFDTLNSEIADVNGDGAIDRNEFNWAFPNVDLYEEFGKLDTNNDGFIDEIEGRGILLNKLIKGAKKLFNKFVG